MSYALSIFADSKLELLEKLRTQFDTIVKGQPQHTADLDAIYTLAQTLVDRLQAADPWERYTAAVSGSIGQVTAVTREDNTGFSWISASVNVGVVVRPTE